MLLVVVCCLSFVTCRLLSVNVGVLLLLFEVCCCWLVSLFVVCVVVGVCCRVLSFVDEGCRRIRCLLVWVVW